MAKHNSTTVSPHCISTQAREQATAWLLTDAHRHVADALMSPALDCADLAEQMRTNADAAYAELAQLDLVQLTLQAVCYAAYANELLGLDISGEHVLTFWCVAFARRGLGKQIRYDTDPLASPHDS